MNCPYCGKKMYKGAIPGPGRWYCDGVASEGLLISSGGLLEPNEIPAYYCDSCRKIVIDVPEKVETATDKLKEKWQSFRSRAEEKRNDAAARKQEEQQEKQKEKRRKKDPWEV